MPDMTLRRVLLLQRARTSFFWLLAPLIAASIGLLLAADPARAATFTVNRASDAQDANLTNTVCDINASAAGSQCTLRAAIQEANDTPGADTINFSIGAAAAVKTISPSSPLPVIRKATTIDGYTQPGASPNTLATGSDAVLLIELNGAGAGAGAAGLKITGPGSRIRGLVINRFKEHGVLIAGSGATGNRVEGNFIGTDATGSTDLGNSVHGVFIDGAPNNTVGGTDAADGAVDGVVKARNVISGNNSDGVVVFRESARGNRVQGNRIGSAASGSQALGNGPFGFGVLLSSATNTLIGGTASGAGNTIANHSLEGILIGGSATGNRVQGNTIANNRDGIDLEDTPSDANNLIGGNTSAAGNAIIGNRGDGVSIVGNETTGNSILSNQIFSNGGLGIDLVGGTSDSFRVTENDTDDPDIGANDLQNYPEITSAFRSNTTATTNITGTLNSDPGEEFTIQLFLALDGDPSNHGEGQIFLGSTTTSTDASGDGGFSFVRGGLVAGQEITATATNTASGDTSELSLNRPVVPGT